MLVCTVTKNKNDNRIDPYIPIPSFRIQFATWMQWTSFFYCILFCLFVSTLNVLQSHQCNICVSMEPPVFRGYCPDWLYFVSLFYMFKCMHKFFYWYICIFSSWLYIGRVPKFILYLAMKYLTLALIFIYLSFVSLQKIVLNENCVPG